VLERLNNYVAKKFGTPLAGHFKLSKEMCPRIEQERIEMSKVPYSLAVCSLMYVKVCTRPDIAHAVRAVSRFMSDP
ncbi:hypothetical protein KI387_007741, partial [Taxus chinensis]